MFRWMKTGSTGLLLALLIVIAAACGSNSGTTTSPDEGAASSADSNQANSADKPAGSAAANAGNAADNAAGKPASRMFKDAAGKEINVPASPQKLVAINYVGDLLALGVKPAYTTDYNLDTFGDALSGVGSIGGRPVNPEKVLSLQSDLILADDTGEPTETEQLTKIAPTVTLPFWVKDPYAHLRSVADLLDKKPEAEQWIKDYEAKAADLKHKIALSGKTGESALLLIISGKDMGISGIRNGGFTLYRQLGFAAPPKMQPLLDKDENFGWETVTLESLTALAADRIFVEKDDTGAVTQETLATIKKSPIWQSLAAVKNGNVYEVSNKWGLGDATSLYAQLDEAEAQLLQ